MSEGERDGRRDEGRERDGQELRKKEAGVQGRKREGDREREKRRRRGEL